MVNREVRRLVNDDAAYDELLAAAKKNGYRTMRDSCRDLVLRGITTAEEAARTINSTLDESITPTKSNDLEGACEKS